MSSSSNPLLISNALTQFFEQYQLGADGGLSSNWVKLKIGKFFIPIPNTKERKRALIFHDIHHIVTGYASNWKGEVEIGAWEVASGCGDYMAAWVLDLGSLLIGLFLYPKLTYSAFIRGRRSNNLYHYKYTQEQLMEMSVPELQNILKLEEPSIPASLAEKISFIKWSLFAAAVWVLPGLIFCGILAWWFLR